MSNRITSNIKSSNNPEDRWNSSEVNKDLNKLDNSIVNLSEDLVTTDTTQIINGQKTFFTLFVEDEGSVVTYDKIMEDLPFEISPVFGPATYQFGVNRAVEEGRYNKHNASGATMNVAALNPSFMPSEIYIEVISNNDIYVKALNVPLPKTSLAGSYSQGSSNMDAYLWKTSVSFEGTLEVTSLGSSTAKAHNIYINYNPDTDTVSVDLSEQSIQSENVLTRCIGCVFSKSSSLIRTCQKSGIILFQQEMLLDDIKSLTGGFSNHQYNTNKLFDTCILKCTCIPRIMEKIKYSDLSEYPLAFPENSRSLLQSPQQYTLYIPIHVEGKNLTYTSTSFNRWRVLEINFGDLII